MPRRTVFLPYQPKTMLNKGQRADDWLCTCGQRLPVHRLPARWPVLLLPLVEASCPHDDPADFPYIIRVKENAPALLRRALAHVSRDVIGLGDYQPAERKDRLTRQMLEVCLEVGFPVFILSRSPLVLRDLDLLQAINKRARTVVALSAIRRPARRATDALRNGASGAVEKRFVAMAQIAAAGIVMGHMLYARPDPACATPTQTWRRSYTRLRITGGDSCLRED